MPPGWNHIDGGKMAGAYRSAAWKEYRSKKEKKAGQHELLTIS
jgi:hypothetical protein